MSMVYGAEAGYGMFLNSDERDAFVEKMAKIKELDEMDVLPEEGASNLSLDDGYESWDIDFLSGNHSVDDGDDENGGCFFYANKQGGIIKGKTDLYDSLSDMADEFRKKYGDVLPDDFNYEGHLAHLRASYVC
jgi:hypothetical protein